MGYVATPTPDMGAWRVEVRSESFYLQPPKGERVVSYGEGRHPLMVEFHLEDISSIRSALDQAERVHLHGSRYEWARQAEDGRLTPVEVVHPAETVDASTVPAATWMALVASTGPLAELPDTRDLALEALQDPSNVRVKVAESLVTQLEGRTGLASELSSVLVDGLAAAQREYEEEVRSALGQ